MPTKNSREQDAIAKRASREAEGGVEHERNNATPAGPHSHLKGSIGGGDDKGRQGRVWESGSCRKG